MCTTYEAKEVREVVPPEVCLCEHTGNKPEDHGDDGQANEDGVKRYKAPISCGRATTHERCDVLSRYINNISVKLLSWVEDAILRDSLMLQDD